MLPALLFYHLLHFGKNILEVVVYGTGNQEKITPAVISGIFIVIFVV